MIEQLQELYDRLAKHDWYYTMSDDGRVFREGQAAESRLISFANSIKGGKEMFDAYKNYIYSGPTWGKEPLPKPSRPPGMDDPMF